MDQEKYEAAKRLLRTVLSWVMFGGATLFSALFLGGVAMSMLYRPWFLHTMQDHLAAAVGLPLAAIVSFCLVMILEFRAGPIEFEGLGFKFRGAAGPIVLWVLCFAIITAAIKLLW
jgi:hypothetical protein